MKHDPELDEMITLYTVSEWTVRRIADRFLMSAEAVRQRLRQAGVQLRPSGARAGRPPTPPAAGRAAPGPDPFVEAAARAEREVDYVNAVITSLGGRGFPFLVFGERA